MEPRLSHLLARMRRRFGRSESVAELEEWLSSQGYDRGQIGTILGAWLSDIRGVGRSLPAAEWAVRVQGAHERGRFTPEAWGHLIGLRAAGFLNPMELEQVIERLLAQVEGRITIEDARFATDTSHGDGPPASGDPTIVH